VSLRVFRELSLSLVCAQQTQVRAAQNAAVSGLYWWTTDIGGYSAGDAADATLRALVVRWFQFAAFLPLFRLHGDRAPESIGVCGRTGAPDEVREGGVGW
jgi:alpha-D-xyloside xylohydrolase